MMKKNGFTLIEILIALFVFAILVTITATGLNAILKTRERMNIIQTHLQRVQLAMAIMQQDFTQIINRPIRDGSGNLQPGFLATPNSIEFTKSGYVNPQMQFRQSTLQRVAYRWENNQLIRIVWPILDRAPDTPITQKVLLDKVNQLQVRFLTSNNIFSTTWPPTSENPEQSIPKAIELIFTMEKWGMLQKFFLTPQGNNRRL